MKLSTRRNFLVTAGSLTFGSAALSMIGCGGLFASSGGGATGSLTQVKFNGVLNLPAGTDLTKLRITGPLGIKPLTGNKFQVTGFAQFPVTVTVIEPSTGKTILLGMLDPAASVHVLDSANCAATLLFIALGGSQMFGPERQTFWTGVLALGALPAFATVVIDRLTADLYALENQDAQIIAALNTAANAGGPSHIAQQSSQNLTSSNVNSSGRAPGDVTLFMQSPQAGAEINGIQTINLNNQAFGVRTSKRRESVLHTYVDEGTLAGGGARFANPPIPVLSPIKLASRGASDAMPISTYLDDKADSYDLIHLTPVFDAAEPSIFTSQNYTTEKAVWRTDLVAMYKRAEVGLVAKVLLEAVGMSGVTFNSSTLDMVTTNLQNLGSDTAALVLTAAGGTGLSAGVQAFVQQARSSDPMALDYLQAIAPLVQTTNPVLYNDLSHRNYVSEQLVPFRAALRLIAYTGAMALSLQLGEEYKDLTEGDKGNRFYFRAVKERVRLNPSGGEYFPGTDVPFTITVDGETDPLTYHWSLGSTSNAALDDGHGKTGSDIDTDQTTVVLKTHANSLGTANVTCEVFKGTGANKVSVGLAQTFLTRHGTTGLFLNTYVVGRYTYVEGMTIFDKPKTAEGGNHYKGGRLRADIVYQDLSSPGDNATQHMEFPIPAFTGLPLGDGEPKLTGVHILPDVGGGTSTFASTSVYDFGDRLVLVNIRGSYFDTETQANIDAMHVSVLKFIANTTMSLTFAPSS